MVGPPRQPMNRRPGWMASLPPSKSQAPGRSRATAASPGRVAPAPALPENPGGLGLASDRARESMVETLARGGVRDVPVLDAMLQVPRHQFVEAGLASRAYEDVALPIGHGQTISKPSTVARMIELVVDHLPASQRTRSRALEVGTGCGYQAAVMARVFGQVVSIERVRGLHELARANLRSLRLTNLRLAFGDGHQGVAQGAPYDAIIVAAAGDAIPEALLEQMTIGGRLIAPVLAAGGRQALHRVERMSGDRWQSTVLDAVRFVPLRSGTS